MTHDTQLVIVPHTHWDREWYQTFQQFRIRLVRAVDHVIEALEADPHFRYFTLDGQMIVLEDYLEVRPERAERLKALARSGRLLVGPWYLQPDEFLVGGESLIRNLQAGVRLAESYGGAMSIGYVPDTFGHIAQLPQILRGFGIDNAVFWRGVPPEMRQSGFRWAAPDGSEVLALWLNDETGYANAALLPLEGEALAARLDMIANRMRPQAATDVLLLMNGSDHLEPQDGLPEALAGAEARLHAQGLHVALGTLPQYVGIIRDLAPDLPLYRGELRSSYGAHLLPGVLSARMWLKQRNAACEALLTRWAEPATTFAWALGAEHPTALLALAWKHLLHTHPHDSICGCSIDQVHAEMLPRFAQSEQIAEELTRQALTTLATATETRCRESATPVVVFNPSTTPRTDLVHLEAQLPALDVEVVDTLGRLVPHVVLGTHEPEIFTQEVDKGVVAGMIGIVSEGQAMGYIISDVRLSAGAEPGLIHLDVTVLEPGHGEPDVDYVERAKEQIVALAARDDVTTFRVTGRVAPRTEIALLARDVPPIGAQTLFIRPCAATPETAQATESLHTAARLASHAEELRAEPDALENAYLAVRVEPATGTFTVVDKERGISYSGLNQMLDSGDVGDLYTYAPPATDWLIGEPCRRPTIEVERLGALRATLRITRHYRLPQACTPDRCARASETVECRIVSEVSLSVGARRVEVRTTVENVARDHRLRVLFPVPFPVEVADAEGVFEVTRRPAQPPAPAEGVPPWSQWAELPVATQPQRRFVSVGAEGAGLAVLNRGLAEYEAIPVVRGADGALALTLLRCVEWLSRGDLATRHGQAGPQLHTPEAQGLGSHVFEYALVPHSGMWYAEGGFVAQEAAAFEAPLRACTTERHSGRLPSTWSLVQVAPATVVLSAVKRAERGDGLVVRVYNPGPAAVPTTVRLALACTEVIEVDLNEVDLNEVDVPRHDGRAALDIHRDDAGDDAIDAATRVHVALRSGEIKTLLFRAGEAPRLYGVER